MGDLDFNMIPYGGSAAEDERVTEWEMGLPTADELTPLSQPLVPLELAAAFRIPPEPGRTLLDVHRASSATVSDLRRSSSSSFPPFITPTSKSPASQQQKQNLDASTPVDDADSSSAPTGEEESGSAAAGTVNKRPRLVWTPQLHKRFVDVVSHLGIKNAVPKTIMQLMNVEGLTRENVASHLQKYRLYVKRMHGLSNDGPEPSDHLFFTSTPVPPPSLHEPSMYPMPPVFGTSAAATAPMPINGHHHHHLGGAAGPSAFSFNGFGPAGVAYPRHIGTNNDQ